MGAISAGEWSSFNGIYSSEEADHNDHQFMAADHHFLAHCGVTNDDQLTIGASSLDDQIPLTIWPGTSYSQCSNISEIDNSYPCSFSQGMISSSTYSHPVTWLTSNSSVAFHEESGNENLFLSEADHNHEWPSQEASNESISREESGGNQPTAVDHFPQLNWECDHMTVPEPAMESRSLSGKSKKRFSSQAEEVSPLLILAL